MSVRGDSASISVNEVMDDANVVARGSMLRLKLSLGKKPSERWNNETSSTNMYFM